MFVIYEVFTKDGKRYTEYCHHDKFDMNRILHEKAGQSVKIIENSR